MSTRRNLLGAIALTAGSILIVLLTLELTLRQWPTLLGYAFANGAVSRYTTKSDGIYYYDDRGLGMHFMIPNYQTVMSYNGYVWKHRTDALGFRNDPLHIPADVMLLGDSVVYGHGVDYEHTLGRYLEQRTGLRVANLGRQGDCAYQEAYLLTAYVDIFKPRFVFQVFAPNDIDDLYAYLSDAAMEDFIARSVALITFAPRGDPEQLLRERERRIRQRSLTARASEELYVMKMMRWLPYTYRQWRRSAVVASAFAADEPGRRGDGDVGTNPESLGWRYTEHALVYMKYVTERSGARFVMVPVAQDRQLDILRGIARRHGIELTDTGSLYAGPSFLPNDGHFTSQGARTMGDLIAAAIERLSAAHPGPGRR